MWVVEREGEFVALGITEIADFPQRRKCIIRYLVGDLETMFRQIPAMESWARQQGCDMMEGYGRNGWSRVMKDWTQRYCVLQKDLGHAEI